MQKFEKNIFEKFNKHFEVKNSYSDIELEYINKANKHLKIINYFP
jgi:hypothetical protein